MNKSSLTHPFLIALLFLACSLAPAVSRSQVSVTATGGTTGPTVYTTLKAAFDAVNSGTHTGAVTVSITASTTETATAVLNASGNASASYTSLLVKPAAATNPTITGTIGGALIKLNGADNVTIDGSNTAGGTTRNLTIYNSYTAATLTSAVIWIASASTTDGASSNIVKNCLIQGGSGTTTTVGIISGGGTTLGTIGDFANSNNVIQNNTFTATQNAVYIYGASIYDQNWLITQNTMGSTVAAGKLGYRGILIGNTQNYTISNNIISGVTTSTTSMANGIFLAFAHSGGTISGNKVSDIKNTNTGGYGSSGIYIAASTTASNITVANNFVWDVASYGANGFTPADNGNGIVIDGGGGYDISFNTVSLNTNQTLAGGNRAAAMLVTSLVTTAGSINMRDNIFANFQTVGNVNSRFAFLCTAANNVFATRNYNDYYATSTNIGCAGSNATICNTIAQIVSQFGGNANSVSILPVFVSSTDLHLVTASNTALNNTAVVIAGITSDIDGETRTTTPDMGADEFGNCQTVTFTTQPGNAAICAGGNTSFTGAATNGNNYQWQVNTGSGFADISNSSIYGGATTGTLAITAATAAMNGYTYKLLATSGSGCTAAASSIVTLTVNPLPVVTTTTSGSTSICTGGNVTISVPTGTNLTYQWQNGSTNVPTGGTTASYSANATGNYSVIVANTLTGCNATSTPVAVSVGSGPVAAITPAGPVAVCQGSTTTLSAGSTPGLTYQWLLNGTAITNATGNTYSAGTAGNYTVTVSSGPACNTTSAATSVNVNPLPAATATAAGSTAVCQGNSVTLNANTGSNLSYQWQIGSVNVPTGGTTASYSASTPGSYTVKVTNTLTSCTATSFPVTVTSLPLPTASTTPATATTACDSVAFTASSGTGLTYQWKQNGIGLPGETAINYTATATGSYAVTVTNSNNCSATSVPVAITINASPASVITSSSPLVFCQGGAVALNTFSSPGYTYQWLQNGNPIPGSTGTYIIASQGGSYAVKVTNGTGCNKISQPVTVQVNPLPVPVIVRNGLNLSTGSFATYQWYMNLAPVGGATSQTYNATANGAYSVAVTDANGCTNISSITFINSLGTGGLPSPADFKVYPNPAGSFVSIESGKAQMTGISILNNLGSLVYSHEVKSFSERVDLTGLANGIYMLRIHTVNGPVIRRLEILR